MSEGVMYNFISYYPTTGSVDIIFIVKLTCVAHQVRVTIPQHMLYVYPGSHPFDHRLCKG